jgi:hypothetical protein
MQISLDTDSLENITYRVNTLSGSLDELYSALHSVYSAITDEQVLQIYPQTHLAVEYLGQAAGELYRLDEEIKDLSSVLGGIPGDVSDMEQQLQRKIGDLALDLGVVAENADAAGDAVAATASRFTDEADGSARLEDVLGQEAAGLEIANLASVSKTVEDEYGGEDGNE